MGCSGNTDPLPKPEPIIQNTYLVVEINSENQMSHSFDMEGNEVWHSIQNLPGEPKIEIGCQFVGQALAPDRVHGSKIKSKHTDIYLVSLKVGQELINHYPIQYFGGEKTVVDRSEVKVYFTQKKGEPIN